MNNQKINYQLLLDNIIKQNAKEEKVPTLAIHSCCAPCSSYVLEYLSKFFKITIFYYNPNIQPQLEYEQRVNEQKKLLDEMDFINPVEFCEGDYETEKFQSFAVPMAKEKEGGQRCYECYKFRLEKTAEFADFKNFDYFTTTLSISPYKNSKWINELGNEIEKNYNTKFLPSDFKKKNGYKRSIELSEIFNLYRQDYCGCIYSKIEKEEHDKAKMQID